MAGWKSRYDYPGMSNLEKLTGRTLHTQDNCWSIAVVLYVVLIGLIIWFIFGGDLSITTVVKFYYQYLK